MSEREHVRNPISYLICATERTGSHLLCDALTLTGLAGRPQECFHPARFKQLPAQPDHAAYAAYFERMAQECTTPNGVFGAKVQWWQLTQLVLKLRELPEYRGIGAGELLQSWLPNARYIRLIRRDKVRQAVSHLKAIKTNAWWEMTTWARTQQNNQTAQPTFDADGIERLMRRIRVHEAAWQLFFEDRGIQPLEIVYEDFVQAQEATMLHVLSELRIPAPPDLVIARPRYKKQADGTSEQWVRSYHELRGPQAAHADGTEPIEIPQEDLDIISAPGPALAVPPGPLIQPHAFRERALRIVVYSTQRSDDLPALLARCISQDTVHTAHCVWDPPSGAGPVSAAAALTAADVVLIHDGEVAPRHSALLADKALVILAHHPQAQHSPWLGLGFPGVVLSPLLAPLPAFQGWPHLALPWGSPHDWDRFWMPLIARALPPSEPHGRAVHRSPDPDRRGGRSGMKMTAYPLYKHVVPIEPAPDDPALSTAGGKGWILRCPYAFEATWNGGPAPEDIDIRSEAPDAETPAFVQSHLGAGLLTFYPGYQFQTEAPCSLWVRGPINRPKDGLQALEQIADTKLLPCTVTVTWQCTRPNQTIRFAAGEPFGTILLHLAGAHENAVLDVVALDADAGLEAYEQAVRQLVDAAAVQGVFQRLGAVPSEPTVMRRSSG